MFDNRTGLVPDLAGERSRQVPAGRRDGSYVRALITCAHGPAVSVYVKFQDGRAYVVGVERNFGADNRG